MAVSVTYLFLNVLWVVLQCVIVAFSGHTHFFNQVISGLIGGAPDIISQALLSAPVWGKGTDKYILYATD